MIDRDYLIGNHLAALDHLGYEHPSADVLDKIKSFELLDTESAAIVAGRDASTITKWAQADEQEGAPIGAKVGDVWFISTERLLDRIERKRGLPARREAETKYNNLIKTRACAQKPN
ncbi:hypothetical protein [Rhodoplanes sp. Z2-YC6860]|uniref:hypothetical protein n=1 Tax=Rhodoplanes sp. Z2-YC6860 TaxID=674703 RepID=UPI0008351D7D|nr:hypothetical protein [Rhodoplanes sp. Z2-YC6860]